MSRLQHNDEHGGEADDAADFEQSRAGVAEMLSNLGEGLGLDALSQAAGEAAFDRTVDMVTTMTTEADLRERIRERMGAVVTDETRVVV